MEFNVPHGPILINNQVLRVNDTLTAPSWSPGSINHSVNSDLAEVVYREEPASVSNPVRPDGTRAPSAYEIKHMVIKNPLSRGATENPSGWFQLPSPTCRLAQITGNPADIALYWDYLLKMDDQNCDARARTTFLNKLADASGKDQVSLGVIAGEFRETAGLAADLATGMVKGVRNIAQVYRRPPATIARTLDVLGREGRAAAFRQLGSSDNALLQGIVSSWLVYQFGLKPLAYDVQDGVNFLAANQASDRSLELTATLKGGASEEYKYQRLLNQQGHNASPGRLMGHFVQKTSVNYAGVYKIPTKPSMRQALGLENPALVAWELLRFTWMIDYVIDIGGWLRSFMAAADTTFVEGSKSVLRKAYLDRLSYESVVGTLTQDPSKVEMMIACDHFKRTVVSPAGVMPSFLPGMKNKLDLPRLANSIAALTTLVGARTNYDRRVI